MKTATLRALPPTAFLHGRGPVWDNGKAGRMDFLNLLCSVLGARGYAIRWIPFSTRIATMARADARHLHVVLDDTPVQADNVVFCIPSYLHGFWYFDPTGTRNHSSMATTPFHPEKMSDAYARRFADALRAKFVAANLSKFDQQVTDGFTPEPGAICIFAQTFGDPDYHAHHMRYPALIEAVIAGRGDRRVYIKPHPRQSLDETVTLMGYHDPAGGVEVVDHTIHGLLARAGVAVSLSSAVLLEAQMHGVPGIVGGDVDFHHNMVPVRAASGIAPALKAALTGRFHFDKYLVFFFAQGMVQPRLRDKAVARIDAVLASMGYDGPARS